MKAILVNNEKSLRYYATNMDDVNKITTILKEEYNYRLELAKDKDISFSPYYLIFTDDVNLVKNKVKEYPIVVLDDVFSELDEGRRKEVYEIICEVDYE